nr:probable calcium-binding protein CML21 [Tanacetum cinerariifolium]
MGGKLTKADDSPKTSVPTTKLEAKILETICRRESKGTSLKSFNTIILKFPKIDASLRKCKAIYEQFDEDKSGTIDPKELNHCFRKLEIDFTDEEINDLFEECDINHDMGINFKEFIVLLCLVYLLKNDPVSTHSSSRMGIPELQAFETLVDSFVFLDKNKDGYVSRSEMVAAINETTTGERSSGRIAMRRFEEMDWDKNGMVNFKEFIFAFEKWIGIEDAEEDEEERATQTYSSQRHRQGSRRLLEDILVSWNGYRLICRLNTLMVLRRFEGGVAGGGNTLTILLLFEEEQAELVILFKGESHVINVSAFDIEDFSSWKDRFLVFLDGLEPYLLKNSELNVEKDTRSSSEFLADFNVEFHDRALLANQIRFYKRSKRDDESLSSKDEGTTRFNAFMAIAKDEPSVGKAYTRSGQWVEITMKKVQRHLSITDGDERKHVLDYTHVNLYYVKYYRKNLLNKFNFLNLELSLCKSEFNDLKNTKALNCSLQNEIARLKLENESPKDVVSYLKKGGRGKRKDAIYPKEVLFTKAYESLSKTAPEITSDSKSKCDNQDPLPPLSKLSRAELIGTSNDTKSTSVPEPCPNKKADSSTEKLLLTLMEEGKGTPLKKTMAKLKAQSSQGSSSRKAPMIPKPYIDYNNWGFNDHHSNECEYYLGCDICGSITYDTADCVKKPSPNNRKPMIANRRTTEPTKKYSKESGLKVVFGDNSSGDTEGYDSVNCNGITFTMVAYVNGLKHNLISISQLCDANFKVLFTKT